MTTDPLCSRCGGKNDPVLNKTVYGDSYLHHADGVCLINLRERIELLENRLSTVSEILVKNNLNK